ncbi:MAG: GTPase Era [Wenzhouxiangella sp.]|jgi:GTP-binding protein Era|nr:GTPase Era [Wenzhouxiangella sp.]
MTRSRFGHAALLGRPNVGKSTLLNALVGEHVAIVTHKPQTTRHRLLGVISEPRGQIALVDTPGLHQRHPHGLNKRLNRTAVGALSDVDAVVMVVDAAHWTLEDERVAERVRRFEGPRLLVLNKIDLLKDRSELLAMTEKLSGRLSPKAVLYTAAIKNDGLDVLIDELFACLPEGEPLYPEDEFTDRPARFLAAELVREQLMLQLHQEIPYGLTVQIERFKQAEKGLLISALIVVSEDRHKGMVIGRQGQVLKRVGSRSRLKMADLFGQPVHLELHVRTRAGWIDDERALDELGFSD